MNTLHARMSDAGQPVPAPPRHRGLDDAGHDGCHDEPRPRVVRGVRPRAEQGHL